MEKPVAMFDKLADDIRGLSVHWKQIPRDYAGKEEYCRGRSDGLLEAAIALRQVVKNADGIPTEALTPGSVKALIGAAEKALARLRELDGCWKALGEGDAEPINVSDEVRVLDYFLRKFKPAQEVKPDAAV